MRADQLPDHAVFEKAADCLRTLGHATRLQMLVLMDVDEFNVGELAGLCGISSHLASEHLRLMERCGFLERNRVGKEIFYRIAEPRLRDILKCVLDRYSTSGKRRRKQ